MGLLCNYLWGASGRMGAKLPFADTSARVRFFVARAGGQAGAGQVGEKPHRGPLPQWAQKGLDNGLRLCHNSIIAGQWCPAILERTRK